MQLFDAVQIDDASVRYTEEGYLVADALSARTGIQTYRASELGLEDRDPNAVVRVYRPPAAVFNKDTMSRMAWKTVTNDHPPKGVNPKNWKQLTAGTTGDTVARDGDFIRTPLTLMDARAIEDYKAGKRELSWGYTCEVIIGDGVVPEGEHDAGKPFDATMDAIVPNHLALCDKARGGDKLRIPDSNTGEPKVPKSMLIDGFSVNLEDTASVETAISKVLADRKTAQDGLAAAATTIAEHVATIATRDGEIAVLKADAETAKITPEKLDQLVQARDGVVTVAKAVIGGAFDAKGKTDADIKRAVVAKRVGDAVAAGMTEDAAINGAFQAIAATVDTKKKAVGDDLRDNVNDGGGVDVTDGRALLDRAREERRKQHRTAHQGPSEETQH